MSWRDYVELAKRLIGTRHEASERSAISRAYYGAFNLSRRWVETNVAPVSRFRAHQQVWDTLKKADRATPESAEKWELVGDLGRSLRALRNLADYEDDVPDLEVEARGAIGSAEQIAALLDELEVAD